MITAIEIENFKAIRNRVRVELKPITLLFGPNSAGKSTIVQALHYVREILERHNLDPDRTIYGGEAVELGGFRNMVHNHDLTRPILLRVDLDLQDIDLPDFGLGELGAWDISREAVSGWIEIEIAWSALLEKPRVARYEVGLNGERIASISSSADGAQTAITYLAFAHPLCQPRKAEGTLYRSLVELLLSNVCKDSVWLGTPFEVDTISLGLLGQRSALPEPGRLVIDPESFIEDLQEGELRTPSKLLEMQERSDDRQALTLLLSQIIVGPCSVLLEALRLFRYVGPLRKVPPRNYAAGLSPDEARWSDGFAAWDKLHCNPPEFARQVSDWLLNRLGAGYGIRKKRFVELDLESPLGIRALSGDLLDEDDPALNFRSLPETSRLLLFEEGRDLEILPADVGVGISQLVPVVVAALDAGADFTAIEQPELHVHPAIQVNLGDLFISQIQDGTRIFLLETHSEHLVLRLLRRIRETAEDSLPPSGFSLRPEQLSVIYVEPTPEGMKLSPLRIDETGEFIDRWPRGFFAERAHELF